MADRTKLVAGLYIAAALVALWMWWQRLGVVWLSVAIPCVWLLLRLIGRRGEKLASLQHIVNLIVARREGQLNRIMIDVENYRGRREDQLRDVADRAAQRVAQSGKIIQLEAMPAMERRIVHLALAEHESVRTQSVGVEPNRRVVILPANKVS